MSRKLVTLLGAWAIAAVVAGVALYVLQPSGLLKWLLLVVVGIPACLFFYGAVELLAHAYMSLPGIRHATAYFERRASGTQFSSARAAWYGFTAALGFCLAVALAAALAHLYSVASAFLAQDACLDSGGRWNGLARVCEYGQ